MNEADDIVKWLDILMESQSGGWKKLAASMLIQTLEGRNQLKKLWRENPALIKQTYHYLSDECLKKLRSGQSSVTAPPIDKEEFYPLANSCPFCDTPPDKLTWIFGNRQLDCDEPVIKPPNSWYVICDYCGLQLESFSTEDTPPQIRIKRDKNE